MPSTGPPRTSIRPIRSGWPTRVPSILVLVTKTRERLADLDYDFDALAKLMRDHGLVTLQLVWPESKKRYHSRNPFAGSGVVEDPATGAVAAAFGGYLRELGMIGQTASFTIIQGVEMGRPSEIKVSVIEGEPGVRVSGTAHRIDGSSLEMAPPRYGAAYQLMWSGRPSS